ncbi:MAG: hypothetical protein AAFN07_16020 [Pseudomonadota bacterium]
MMVIASIFVEQMAAGIQRSQWKLMHRLRQHDETWKHWQIENFQDGLATGLAHTSLDIRRWSVGIKVDRSRNIAQ